MLAVEFPSPCDGSESCPALRLRRAGAGEDLEPPRRNAISIAKLSLKDYGLSIGFV
jgi:hypothetical protein